MFGPGAETARHSRVLPLLVFLFLLAVYQPAVTGSYVFHDEIYYFSNPAGTLAKHPLHDISIAMGRPLAAWLLTSWTWIIHTVSGLKIFRFVCFLQIAASAFICFRLLEEYAPLKWDNALITAMVFTLPSFQVMIFYAGPIASSVLFAVMAGYVTCHIPGGKSFPRKMTDPRMMLSLLLAAATLIYAPGAAMYWFVLALVLFAIKDRVYAAVKAVTFNFMAVGMINYGIFFVMLMILKSKHQPFARGIHNPYVMNLNIYAKLKWFVSEPLVNALNFWNIYPSAMGALAVFLLMLVCFVIAMAGEEKRIRASDEKLSCVRKHTFYALTFFALTGLTYLPNLLSAGGIPVLPVPFRAWGAGFDYVDMEH